jgi:NAD(P)-dependent dehydrogenase (short-subunit alcohol dehydrogenase family)
MSNARRVAVVTGANRGMGLETCRQLAKRGLRVVLTARDAQKGEAAAAGLRAENLDVAFHPLDVTDDRSVAALADHVERAYGRLDVLVNNAGAVLEEPGSRGFFDVPSDVLARAFDVNALGAARCCRALVPLMRKNGYGRVVNVSTGMAALHGMNGGWPAYRMSKTALNALTRLLSEELGGTGVKVNSVCPGHVQTEMGGLGANRTVEEGVDTTLWLATLHDDGPTGGFFRDCKQIDW